MQTSTYEDLSIPKAVIYAGMLIIAGLLLVAIALVGKRKK